MNRRTFVSRALLTGALIALAASSVSAASPSKNLQQRPVGPTQPGGLAAPGGGSNATYEHDSDAQLDVWVARCKAKNGGMSVNADDGNYECRDANGNIIEDY